MKSGAVIVIDTETGGLDPSVHGLTEIACVLARHPDDWRRVDVEDRFSVLIRPNPRLRYEPKALELQHRTLADLAAGTTEDCALLMLYGWLRGVMRICPDARVWAHNADFDRRFLLAAHDRLNLGASDEEYVVLPIPTDWRCSMQLWRDLRTGGVHDQSRSGLDIVMAHYGLSVPVDRRHTATADCEVTAQAVGCMMRDWRQLPGQTREARIAGGTLGPGHGVVAP